MEDSFRGTRKARGFLTQTVGTNGRRRIEGMRHDPQENVNLEVISGEIPVISGYLSSAFDLLNVGDLDLIAQARERCDHLVVGVQSDEYVERVTGRAPVVPLVERMALVSHLRGVDVVIMHDDVDQPEFGSTDTVFTVTESAEPRRGDRVHRLSPTRQTQSRAIRAALAPQARTGVA